MTVNENECLCGLSVDVIDALCFLELSRRTFGGYLRAMEVEQRLESITVLNCLRVIVALV